MMKVIIALFFISLWSIQLTAQSIDPKLLDAHLEKIITGKKPGIAVGIVHKGKTVYTHYNGYANLAHEIAINNQSRFNIASNAKQFTAFCILTLAQQDQLNLNDDIRKYFPDFYSDIEEPITINHLLNHTSGIRDAYDLMNIQGNPWWRREGLDNNDILKLLASQMDLNFTPGTKHVYSNSNYTLLAEIVSKTSKQSFKNYSDSLFISIGMQNTHFATNYMSIIPNKALPYSNWGNGEWNQWPMITNLIGDGFLYTTLGDQLLWEKILQQDYSKNQFSESIAQSQQLSNTLYNYGYGIEFGEFGGYDIIKHEGATGSYGAYFMRFPSLELSIVVLSNSGSIWTVGIAQEIAKLVLPVNKSDNDHFLAEPQITEKKPRYQSIVGKYELENNGGILSIETSNGKLYRKMYGRKPVELVHLRDNIFFYKGNEQLKIAFSSKGKTSCFTLYHPQLKPRIATALLEQNITSPTELNGTYLNSELAVEFTMQYDKEDRFLILYNEKEREAQMITNNQLRMDGFTFNVIRDNKEKVINILVDYNRNMNINFKKVTW